MSFRAVITDMDGTLLNHQSQITAFTKSVLHELHRAGVKLIIATGRPAPDVFATVRKCGLNPDYVITSNGAYVYDGDCNLLRAHDINPSTVRALISMRTCPDDDGELNTVGEAKAFSTNIYRRDEWLTDIIIPEAVASMDESFPCIDLGDSLHELREEELTGVHQVYFQGPHEDLVRVQRHVCKYHHEKVNTTFPLPFLLDCTEVGSNKGAAATEVAALLNMRPSEMVAFGDGMNDTAMLSIAGKAFVMPNAHDMVKEAVAPFAEEVEWCNDDDGVARKIQQLFRLSSP